MLTTPHPHRNKRSSNTIHHSPRADLALDSINQQIADVPILDKLIILHTIQRDITMSIDLLRTLLPPHPPHVQRRNLKPSLKPRNSKTQRPSLPHSPRSQAPSSPHPSHGALFLEGPVAFVYHQP